MYNCLTVAAAQFGVYAVYVCATQHSLMMQSEIVCRSERATGANQVYVPTEQHKFDELLLL